MIILNKISHDKITPDILERICKIKTIAQPYNIEELKKWIQMNLNPNDMHFLLTKDSTDIAYLNLVEASVSFNRVMEQIWGIGNVCAIERGKGYGREIMELTNEYLKNNDKIGLLFCKKELVRFYASMDWLVIDNSLVKLNTTRNDVITMTFNHKNNIKSLEYNSKLF